ncbi:MAG: ABC transporter ATP-binding protein [Rhizobiaceae bacterium]|nr:ABC transporter ATP-binding protein [Rhizobiaceae bacterium]
MTEINGNIVPKEVLKVSDLSVEFGLRSGLFKPRRTLKAVSGVSLKLEAGKVLGIVGESGSGKTTTGRALMRLVEPSAGSIELSGVDITNMSQREFRRYRRHVQMVFQDPYSSLDPSMVVGESIAEPLIVHEGLNRRARDARVRDLLIAVGLAPALADRYPYELSGGQRQRISIARAIAVRPDVLVCDEAISALDVSAQNGIILLLDKLRGEMGTALVFISHDLSVVRNLADWVAVMYLGRVVEEGPPERVYAEPAHPYTEALISAIPVPNPRIQRERRRIRLKGELPDPSNRPKGCPFSSRCSRVMDICAEIDPTPTSVAGGGETRCHLHTAL